MSASRDSKNKSTVDESESNFEHAKSGPYEHWAAIYTRTEAETLQKFLPRGFSLVTFDKKKALREKRLNQKIAANEPVIEKVIPAPNVVAKEELQRPREKRAKPVVPAKKAPEQNKEFKRKLMTIMMLLKSQEASKSRNGRK